MGTARCPGSSVVNLQSLDCDSQAGESFSTVERDTAPSRGTVSIYKKTPEIRSRCVLRALIESVVCECWCLILCVCACVETNGEGVVNASFGCVAPSCNGSGASSVITNASCSRHVVSITRVTRPTVLSICCSLNLAYTSFFNNSSGS